MAQHPPRLEEETPEQKKEFEAVVEKLLDQVHEPPSP